MPYELRFPGKEARRFETEAEAVAAAREAILADPDAEPELFDAETGRPATPAGSRSWREELSSRTGF